MAGLPALGAWERACGKHTQADCPRALGPPSRRTGGHLPCPCPTPRAPCPLPVAGMRGRPRQLPALPSPLRSQASGRDPLPGLPATPARQPLTQESQLSLQLLERRPPVPAFPGHWVGPPAPPTRPARQRLWLTRVQAGRTHRRPEASPRNPFMFSLLGNLPRRCRLLWVKAAKYLV